MPDEFNWPNFGRAAYETYRARWAKDPAIRFAEWDALNAEMKEAWISAAQEVCRLFGIAATV